MKNYLNKFNLKNKYAFILGGMGLIGSHITKAFLDAGCKILILDINKSKAIKLLNKTKSKNIKFQYFDLSDVDNLENNFEKILKLFGTPDIFINSSYPITADWYNSTFNKNSLKITRQNSDIHLNTYVWTSARIAKAMQKEKINGSIVLLSSIYGLLGQNLSVYGNTKMSENMNYSFIKGGIINHARQMSSYYGQFNIRVNALCPGGVVGHIAGSKLKQNKTFIKNYIKNTPLKRLCKPEEVASSALFLASDASSYITGTTFMVDGGWSAI